MTSPYGGSAGYYQQGRLPYPSQLADRLIDAVPAAAGGRLLDIGCGPGRFTRVVADRFASVVGVDADPGMIERARAAGIPHARFLHRSAEELPGDLGGFDLVTFALSFHWLDQQRVTRAAYDLLEPGGACVHVHAWSLRGDPVVGGRPLPPYDAVSAVLDGYLGPERRLAHATPGEEAEPMRAAGFVGPAVVLVPGGEVVTSTIDDLVARSYSTSGATPERLGGRQADAERELRQVLADATSDGRFDEQLRDARLAVWHRP